MTGERKAFALRLDPALYAVIERTASAELRSANAQIEVLLREALARRGVKVAQTPPPRRGRPARGAPNEERPSRVAASIDEPVQGDT